MTSSLKCRGSCDKVIRVMKSFTMHNEEHSMTLDGQSWHGEEWAPVCCPRTRTDGDRVPQAFGTNSNDFSVWDHDDMDSARAFGVNSENTSAQRKRLASTVMIWINTSAQRRHLASTVMMFLPLEQHFRAMDAFGANSEDVSVW